MSDIISPGYLEMQRVLHSAPKGYGGKGGKWAAGVAEVARDFHCSSVLDFGCGRGSLGTALRAAPLGLKIREYDPAIQGKDGWPKQSDLVVCTDVLEHIEPDKLSAVLQCLKELAHKAIFVVIATRPANKVLSDGRNAHLIIEDATWWTARLTREGFVITPGPPSPSPKPSRELVAILTRPTW